VDLDDAHRITEQMIATAWDGVPVTMDELREALAEADAHQDDPAWQAAAAQRLSGMASVGTPALVAMTSHDMLADQDLARAILALPTRHDSAES
jgi:hypothetical protein